VNDYLFCLGVPNIYRTEPTGIGEITILAKPISDPRNSCVSGLHFLCPYLEVNLFWSSIGEAPFCRG
jgi:hypothetical protein